MSHNAYPKETVELVELQVTYSGARVPLAELFFMIVPDGDSPDAGVWVPAVVDVLGRQGLWLDGTLPAGRYRIYCQHVPGTGALPVLDAGTIDLY